MSVQQAVLTDVISDIVETLAMMGLEVAHEFRDFVPDFIGHIDFEGTVRGRLFIECTDEFADTLAENLLGLESSELDESHKWDAIGELLNVICGNLVTELFDSKNSFTLSVPQVSVIDSGANSGEGQLLMRDSQYCAECFIDGFPVRFTLKLDS